jgi:hypothetical protein
MYIQPLSTANPFYVLSEDEINQLSPSQTLDIYQSLGGDHEESYYNENYNWS